MNKSVILKELHYWHIAPLTGEELKKPSKPLIKARILTGNDAAHLTGSYEPCLAIDNIIMTRTNLLEYLFEMSQMEGKDVRRY